MIFDYVGWGITADNQPLSGIKRTAAIPYYDADEQFHIYLRLSGQLVLWRLRRCGFDPLEDGSYAIAGVKFICLWSSVQPNILCGWWFWGQLIDSNFDWIREYVPEPPPPVVEEPEEENEGDNVDPDSKEGILTDVAPSMLAHRQCLRFLFWHCFGAGVGLIARPNLQSHLACIAEEGEWTMCSGLRSRFRARQFSQLSSSMAKIPPLSQMPSASVAPELSRRSSESDCNVRAIGHSL